MFLRLCLLALLPLCWAHSCHNPSPRFCHAVEHPPAQALSLPWNRSWYDCPHWVSNCVSGAYTECHPENGTCICSNRRFAVEACPSVCEGLSKTVPGFCVCPQYNTNCFAAGEYCGIGEEGQCHCPATCI